MCLRTADRVLIYMGRPRLGPGFRSEVEAFLEVTGTKVSVLGEEAAGNRSFVGRLRKGASPSLRTVDRIRTWMAAHASVEEMGAIRARIKDKHDVVQAAGPGSSTAPLPSAGAGINLEEEGGKGMYGNGTKYLSTREAAAWLGLSPRALPLWAACLVLTACIGRNAEVGQMPVQCDTAQGGVCVPEEDVGQLPDENGDRPAGGGFANQWGLKTIRADQAYENLKLRHGSDAAPGAGVTVGVLDTGIDAAHPHFRNKNIVQRFLSGGTGDDGSAISHGTAVASIIAGEEVAHHSVGVTAGEEPSPPDNSEFEDFAHGVAWGADLVVFSIPAGSTSELYKPLEIHDLPGAGFFILGSIDQIVPWRYGGKRIEFLNLSVGFQGIIEDYSEADLRAHFGPALASLAQEGSEEKIILVWAAGNANGWKCAAGTPHCVDGKIDARSVELLPGLTARIPELRGHSVAVVSVRQADGRISDFSTRCGIAADYCLAAPGEGVRVAYFGPDEDGNPGARGAVTRSGTSLAAPFVTGGLALVQHYFRNQLSGTEVLSRLLETADRSGFYADAEIYGRGLMDLGAATSPVGEPAIALGDRAGERSAGLRTTGLWLGPAFGDALGQSLADREIAAFDSLGAPFWYDLGQFARTAAGPSLSDRLRDFQREPDSVPHHTLGQAASLSILDTAESAGRAAPALQFVATGTSAAARGSHFAVAERNLVATLPLAGGLTASALTSEGLSGQEPVSGAALTWRHPKASLGFRAGWMGERQTLLGTVPDGAFGDLRANAVFAGIDWDARLGPWRAGARAEVGTVNAQARNGLLADVSPLTTSAFGLHAVRRISRNGTFHVSLSQPLRVERGRAQLSVPSGRTRAGEVIRNAVDASLAPTGRQVDLAVQWRQTLRLGVLSLGMTVSREPDHRRNAQSELVLLSSWRIPL